MQKSFLAIVLSTASSPVPRQPAGQDDADLQAGQAIAEFYETARNILPQSNDANTHRLGEMSFSLGWEDVLYGPGLSTTPTAPTPPCRRRRRH